MKEQGVRQDDPEFLKAHNLLTAISHQQHLARQRQAYAQQQQQAQHRHQQQQQQQQNGGNSQAATNGVNGIFPKTASYAYLIDAFSQDVLPKLRSHPPPQVSNLQPLQVHLHRPSLRLLQLALLLPPNLPQMPAQVSAPNNCRCSGTKFWHLNYCQKILRYPKMSNSNSLLRSKPSGLPRPPRLLQQLIKLFSKWPKLEVVQLEKTQDLLNRGHGTTLSNRLTSTCRQPSITQITESEVEGL